MHRIHKSNSNVNTNTEHLNRALTDPVRINIVEALRQADMSLSELTEVMHVNESLMRYHLRLLVRTGVLDEYKAGARTMYTISQPAVAQACHIIYTMWAKEVARPATSPRLTW